MSVTFLYSFLDDSGDSGAESGSEQSSLDNEVATETYQPEGDSDSSLDTGTDLIGGQYLGLSICFVS